MALLLLLLVGSVKRMKRIYKLLLGVFFFRYLRRISSVVGLVRGHHQSSMESLKSWQWCAFAPFSCFGYDFFFICTACIGNSMNTWRNCLMKKMHTTMTTTTTIAIIESIHPNQNALMMKKNAANTLKWISFN